MRALSRERLPKIVTRAGFGLVLIAAITVAVVAETTSSSSAGGGHASLLSRKAHQRVNHFNVGATHSPKLLRELRGPRQRARAADSGPLQGSATRDSVQGTAAGDPVQGVDVAAYQHPNGDNINWNRVARSGIQFAAVKVTEGTYYKNPFALTDLAEAKAAGLSVMAYTFAVPNGNGGSASAAAQADYLVNYLASAGRRVPTIALDIEYNPYGTECYGLSQSAMRSWIAQFSREVLAKTGEDPVIYGPVPWWQDCTGGTSRFGQFPLWVPYWTTASRPVITHGWSNYTFWQYSSAGTVNGINAPGNVDLDRMNPAVIPLLEPGSQTSTAGASVDLQIRLAAKVAGQKVSYTAAGLPPGLSISPTGQITGWPAATGTYSVTVTASDSAGQSGSVAFGWTVGPGKNAGSTGLVQLDLGSMCLTVPHDGSATGTPAEIKVCSGTSAQTWTYALDGTLRINNQCLTIPAADQGTVLKLEQCASTAAQQWHMVFPRGLNPALGGRRTALVNPWSGMCLADPGYSQDNGTKVVLWPCNGYADQSWTLPPGPVMSGLAGMCLDDSGDLAADQTKADIWSCNGSAAQAWQAQADGTVRINGKCLDVAGGAKTGDSPVDLFSCNGTQAQQWRLVPSGSGVMLVNPGSGMCLADPTDATVDGTQLVINPCTTSDPGMSWRVS